MLSTEIRYLFSQEPFCFFEILSFPVINAVIVPTQKINFIFVRGIAFISCQFMRLNHI